MCRINACQLGAATGPSAAATGPSAAATGHSATAGVYDQGVRTVASRVQAKEQPHISDNPHPSENCLCNMLDGRRRHLTDEKHLYHCV